MPQFVNAGPICDNIVKGDQVNIRAFPAAHWHEGDGGAYIGTECLVITKDPDSDWVNIGTYRVMVQDRKTLTVFIEPGKQGDVIRRKYWAKGEPCPKCRETAFTLQDSRPDPIFGDLGARIDRYLCSACGYEDERSRDPGR